MNSTFLVRSLLSSSFAFTAISSCMMVLFLFLVTTACSLVFCIWFTIALFKKLCIVFLFVCLLFFHYLSLCVETAERMVVIQWGSVDRLMVRKICNFFWCLYKVHVFLKLFHVLWCMLMMFYLFWQQCALICSVVFDYFYIYVDLQSMFIDQNVDLGSIWGVWNHVWYHKKHNFMLLESRNSSLICIGKSFLWP